MKYIGAHVSISGGVETAPARGTAIGARALGIFTKNQRQWKASPLTDETVSAFKADLSEAAIKPEHVVVHDSYLINIGNPDSEKLKNLGFEEKEAEVYLALLQLEDSLVSEIAQKTRISEVRP